MKKIPKIWLLASIGLFTTSASCEKTEASPDSLEFVCQGEEKTLQTFNNEDAVVRKIKVNRFKPDPSDAKKAGTVYSDEIYILTIRDTKDSSKNYNLVPSVTLSSDVKVDNLNIKFNGDKKNCSFSSVPNPGVYYLPNFDFTIGNKINITTINKK
jgi:hypothetical protein